MADQANRELLALLEPLPLDGDAAAGLDMEATLHVVVSQISSDQEVGGGRGWGGGGGLAGSAGGMAGGRVGL